MGSGEFEPWSEEVERIALGGRSGAVAVLPTASSAEGDEVFERWARMGLEHYGSIGVDARLVDVRTRADAERTERAAELEGTAMVFFSGGKPQHLASTIHGTRLWDALTRALDDGAVFAGCSAGALIASQRRERGRSNDARTGWTFGLGLVPHVSFGVHWDKLKVIPGLRTLGDEPDPEEVVVRGSGRTHGDPRRRGIVEGLRGGRRDGPARRRDRRVPLGRRVPDARLTPGRRSRILGSRELDRRPGRARAPADVLPVRPPHVRSRQTGATVGAGDVWGPAGARVPTVPGGAPGLGGATRPLRVLRRDAAVRDARAGRVPGLRARARRTGRARVDGRLAQR